MHLSTNISVPCNCGDGGDGDGGGGDGGGGDGGGGGGGGDGGSGGVGDGVDVSGGGGDGGVIIITEWLLRLLLPRVASSCLELLQVTSSCL